MYTQIKAIKSLVKKKKNWHTPLNQIQTCIYSQWLPMVAIYKLFSNL